METHPVFRATKELFVVGDLADPTNFALATRLGLSLQPIAQEPSHWHLILKEGNLLLVDPSGESLSLNENEVDQRRTGFTRSGLARACGATNKPRILDALGGWGTDGLSLAAFGCEVVCCESNPMVCAMSHARAIKMNLHATFVCDDALEYLRAQSRVFDTIYLDPMFPEHPTGARPSKSMQWLARLAGPCDISAIFAAALASAMDRVVVKRRANQATELPEPDWSIRQKTVRFDVYRTSSR